MGFLPVCGGENRYAKRYSFRRADCARKQVDGPSQYQVTPKLTAGTVINPNPRRASRLMGAVSVVSRGSTPHRLI